MNDPFSIHEDDIARRRVHDNSELRWVEGVVPRMAQELSYLKPSLRLARSRTACIIFLSCILLLLGRSVKLQIFDVKKYQDAAETNRSRIIRIKAQRGAITDAAGNLFTENIPRFQFLLDPLALPRRGSEKELLLERISRAANLSVDWLRQATSLARLPISPLPIATNLTLSEVYPLMLATQGIPGITLETISARSYLRGESFAHVLGYLGKITAEEAAEHLAQGYALTDSVGRAGVEAALEQTLRGKDGRKHVEVDAAGNIKAVLSIEDATAGSRVSLTIDGALQEKVFELLARAFPGRPTVRASAVVIDPRDGAIRALVSLPSFDNNLFTIKSHITPDAGVSSQTDEALRVLFADSNQPLFFRAISGTYPSGSTIKPAIAAAALQERIITPVTSFLSVGGFYVGEWFFPDWKAGGHGITDVRKAIAESVNTFFYIIGGGNEQHDGLGVSRLLEYLSRFGFGKVTGLDIPGEVAGFIPTEEWQREKRQTPWYIGDTYHLAIGQGDFSVTPLQIARMTAYFASSGKWTTPHLVMNQESGIMNQERGGPGIDQSHIQTVRQGMRQTVLSGSARALQALPVTAAGKTGTAQWSSTRPTHAWFTGFAPYENPEIAVTVLVEEGGEGSSTATPIARDIIQWWYMQRMKHE